MPKIEMFYVGGLILGKNHQYQNLVAQIEPLKFEWC
jgi:hypothetical protein